MNLEETYDALEARFGPVGRTLSRLIRPAFIAPEGQRMLSADWSAIEARGLPWLAGNPGGEKVLSVFRTNDADPSLPDIYKVQAGLILGIAPLDVTKAQRQSHGKVPVLSLGYLGGVGALSNMARAYRVVFAEDEKQRIVDDYRRANPWLLDFADDSWNAVLRALDEPDTPQTAGRVTYVFVPDYRKGTLFTILPCGRALMYPSFRWERRQVKNKFTGEIEEKVQLTYRRGRARSPVWKGLLCLENPTQAVCGSLLRWTLREFELRRPGVIVGHTHDEIIGLAPTARIEAVAEELVGLMNTGPGWAAGLPLKAEPEITDWYTKTEG